MAEETEQPEEQEEDLSIPIQEHELGNTEVLESFNGVITTHKRINKSYSGDVIALNKNYSKISFLTTVEMSVDELGLIHSGFVFASADYAAIMAVNEEHTVSIGSKVHFLAPVKMGEVIEFEARVKFEELKKREVRVVGAVNDIQVFQGTFYVVVLDQHIFKTKIKKVKKKSLVEESEPSG